MVKWINSPQIHNRTDFCFPEKASVRTAQETRKEMLDVVFWSYVKGGKAKGEPMLWERKCKPFQPIHLFAQHPSLFKLKNTLSALTFLLHRKPYDIRIWSKDMDDSQAVKRISTIFSRNVRFSQSVNQNFPISSLRRSYSVVETGHRQATVSSIANSQTISAQKLNP